MKRLPERPITFMSESEQPVICLDFDGVLCESIYECLIVAYSVFYQKHIRHLDEVPAPIKDYFLRYRYFVAPAYDYALIFQAYESGIQTLTRERFNALCRQDLNDRLSFGQRFFEYRNLLRQDLQAWLGLHVLFEQAACVRQDEFPCFNIMTTKDKKSVELLAQSLGFSHKLSSIYAKEVSVDKSIQFQTFFQDRGINPRETDVIFVDDNIEHLHKLNGMGLHLYHAAWGYCDKQELSPFAVAENLDFMIDSEFQYEALKDTD